MRSSNLLIWLCALIALLALIAAAIGLFTHDNTTIGLHLIGQGAAQLLLKVPLPIGAILGFMLSFATSTIVALCLTVVLFRNLADATGTRSA